METTQPTIKQINTSSRFNREMTLINGDVCDLTKQKEELVVQLTKQLVALTNDRMSITDQNTTNDLLGTDISSIVSKKARPSEATKFRSYVDDVGHITMLLLSLSGRLARIENSLFSISDATEKVRLIIFSIFPIPTNQILLDLGISNKYYEIEQCLIHIVFTISETIGQQTCSPSGAIRGSKTFKN